MSQLNVTNKFPVDVMIVEMFLMIFHKNDKNAKAIVMHFNGIEKKEGLIKNEF